MPILYTEDTGAADGYDTTTFNVHVTVAAGATITTEAGYTGINLGTGGFDSAQNNGSINSGEGIFLGGSNDYAWNSNSGTIMGYNGIVSTASSNTILNDGSIDAAAWAVEVSSANNNYVVNHGVITSGYDGVAIWNSNAVKVTNYGTISGQDHSIDTTGGAGLTITNLGTLEGDVLLANTGTTLINRGLILGNVQLGGGTNLFNGVGGEVTGTITGGNGNDTLKAGSDGETLDGGAGINQLYGGVGADTFVYSALGAGDSTSIHGFNAAMDTIQLDSSVFTKLTAGVTPLLSIGAAATSAADHLFYNSASGGLYYDADGSGAGAAQLLGHIGVGLKLTASNFAVA